MESVVRMVIETFFENILKRITELDSKIITIDTKITKIEHDILLLKLKIDSSLSIPDSIPDASNCKMEEVD